MSSQRLIFVLAILLSLTTSCDLQLPDPADYLPDAAVMKDLSVKSAAEIHNLNEWNEASEANETGNWQQAEGEMLLDRLLRERRLEFIPAKVPANVPAKVPLPARAAMPEGPIGHRPIHRWRGRAQAQGPTQDQGSDKTRAQTLLPHAPNG